MSDETEAIKTTALILPGMGNSGPEHWQTLWERANPSFARVQQRDWNHPDCDEWRAVLEESVARAGADVVLIAHSMACALVAHWAAKTTLQIKGALLVAPADPEGPSFPKDAVGFAPVPRQPLRFHSIVVASTDDPYAGPEYARSVAEAWGSRFVSIGPKGHINSESGLGDWPEGFSLFQELTA